MRGRALRSRRSLRVWSAVLAVATALVLAAPTLRLAFDEGAVPPSSDTPALPTGVTVAREEVACGSGGCWRELTLRGPRGQSAADLAASVGLPQEVCSARSLLDRRRVCTGIHVIGERVLLYVQFDRSWSLW
ncbi:hypothetical protein [Blastococcus sp. SYSU DS0616]